MVCNDQGYTVSGCYFYSNGQAQKLNPGEQREVGKVTHFCEGIKSNQISHLCANGESQSILASSGVAHLNKTDTFGGMGTSKDIGTFGGIGTFYSSIEYLNSPLQ
jgi:hypothetical protein